MRENWRARFEQFAENLGSVAIYVTIDLDCLRAEEAVTSWESGRFAVADLVWGLEKLRQRNRIVGGDICGAWSPPRYARWKQKFASEMDHPKLSRPDPEKTRRINQASLQVLWPVLTE